MAEEVTVPTALDVVAVPKPDQTGATKRDRMKEAAKKSKHGLTLKKHKNTKAGIEQQAPNSTGGIKKPRKWRSGTVARRMYVKLSRSKEPVFPLSPIDRWIKEEAQNYAVDGCAFQVEEAAKLLIRNNLETFAHNISMDALAAMKQGGRVTVLPKDIDYAVRNATQSVSHMYASFLVTEK